MTHQQTRFVNRQIARFDRRMTLALFLLAFVILPIIGLLLTQ